MATPPVVLAVNGEPFALLLEGVDGPLVVPPVVMDREGNVLQGRDLDHLRAPGPFGFERLFREVVETLGAVPTLRDRTVRDLAAIDRQVAQLCEDHRATVLDLDDEED